MNQLGECRHALAQAEEHVRQLTIANKYFAVSEEHLHTQLIVMQSLVREAFDRFTDNDMQPANYALQQWLEKAIAALS